MSHIYLQPEGIYITVLLFRCLFRHADEFFDHFKIKRFVWSIYFLETDLIRIHLLPQ